MRKHNSTSMKRKTPESDFVELPTGIFTAEGIWFHTSESLLRDFAGTAVDRKGLSTLFREAAAWFRSSGTVAVLYLAVALHWLPVTAAAISSIVIFLLWRSFFSHFVLVPLVRASIMLGRPLVQGIVYIVSLSLLGIEGAYAGLIVGLAGFVLYRWGIVEWLFSRLKTLFPGEESPLPLPDRILRALLLRYTVAFGEVNPSIEEYEAKIIEIWQRGKRS
jgi:hypothetical protein